MKKVLLIVLMLLLGVSQSIAATTFYTDRAAFNMAVSGLTFESFEYTNLPVPFESYAFPGFTLGEANGINLVTDVIHNNVFGNYPVTDGINAVWYDDNGNSIGYFNFNSGIKAFGIDVTTDEINTMTVGGDVSYSFDLLANKPQFFGVISTDYFDNVTFSASGGPEVGFDSLSFGNGTVVPIPGAVWLLGSGLLGLGGWRRFRKS
jgi:hypothetical protein